MNGDASRDPLPERHESLWLLAGAPAVGTGHFLLSYGTAAVWCAKFAPPDGSLGPVHVAIGVYTAIALALIGAVGWRGFRRHRLGGAPPPPDDDSPAGRHRFLGLAALLLAGMSAIAVLYVQLAAAAIRSCR